MSELPRDSFWQLGSQYSDSRFVGRKPELLKLGSALQRAKDRSGSLLLLSGEAGVGKTRLALEFGEFARLNGAKVLLGRTNNRMRVPFGMWKQFLTNGPIQDCSPSDDLICETPARGSRLPIPLPNSDFQSSEADSLEAAARVLVDVARRQPVVLVFDDVQAGDGPSLEVFPVLARELSSFGSMLIAVHRNSESDRFPEFARLLSDPITRDAQRIFLEGFADSEIREFLESRSPIPVDAKILRSVSSLTAGNPRLLEIALRLNLLADRRLPEGARIRGLLRAEIECHLEDLSPEARATLAIASVIGAEFESSLLAHASEQNPAELLDALTEAERAGVAVKTLPGRFRFRQSLIREVLYEQLSGSERARLHLRIGDVLEDLHSNDDDYLSKIAHHFYEAVMVGGAKKAIQYCALAGDFADLRGQLHEAADLYEMALSAMEFQRADSFDRRELNLRLKDVLARKQQCGERTGQAGSGSRAEAGSGSRAASDPSAKRSVSLEVSREVSRQSSVAKGVESVDLPSRHGATAKSEQPSGGEAENLFRREGDFWTLKYHGQIIRLRHSNGLVFIAYLLKHLDQEIHVVQLTNLLGETDPVQAVHLSRSDKERLGVHTSARSESGPLLDSEAKASYRQRLEELRDELKEAKTFNDVGRAEKAQAELEFLNLELGRAMGLGGRDRKHSDETQRARVNVANAVRSLVAKISTEHPSLARHLRLAVRTGYFCKYCPDARPAPRWQF